MRTALARVRLTAAPIRNAFLLLMVSTVVAMSGIAADAQGRNEAAPKNWRDANASIDSRKSFSGVASFYGNKDEPKGKTASGQKFDENAMTAAHLTLPFGTRLKVTHEGRSVVVTINDRGPYIKGRVLDLSKGAAEAIGITEDKGLGTIVAEIQ